jgi:hypothetical protein
MAYISHLDYIYIYQNELTEKNNNSQYIENKYNRHKFQLHYNEGSNVT